MKIRISFKTKALFFFCLVIILISVAYTLVAIRAEQGLLRDEIIKRGKLVALVAARNAELPLLAGNNILINEAASSLSAIKDVSFVTFYDSNFNIIAYKGNVKPNKPPARLPASIKNVRVFEYDQYYAFYAPVFSLTASEDLDIFQEEKSTRIQKEQLGWVSIGLSTAIMEETARNLAREGALFAALLIILSVVLVKVLLGVVFKPLNALYSAVQGLQEGEYPEVPVLDTKDEIGQLATEFNKMSLAIKDREQKLWQSQKRIRKLFERVEHAVFRLDKDFRIIESNRKFKELCCEEGTDFLARLSNGKRADFAQAAFEGKLIEVEVTMETRDSSKHTTMLSLYPELDEESELVGFDGHFVDITQMRLMEEALLQTQKMEAIGSLAGGVAHDFNNILTSILGYSEIILMEIPEHDPLREKVEVIYNAGNRAASLTRQLLAFSRKQVMELKVVELNELIRNMTKMLGRLIGEDVELKMDLSPGECNIKADPSQIEQIVMNLSVNARDAMPEGGSLIFETNIVYLDEGYSRTHPEVTPGNYVVLIVSDTGFGMTPEVKEKIFDPFFTTKDKGAGTGLGLATVYGVVKQMDGSIFVYSEPGQGTTFKIYFHQERTRGREIDTDREDQVLLRGNETILVVDDEPFIRDMITDTLEPLGYKILQAENGIEALKIYEKLPEGFDLLLTDVVMPKMSGRELANELSERIKDLKVLYMSGYTDDIIVHQGVLEPWMNFIHKPLVGSSLARKVREVLDTK